MTSEDLPFAASAAYRSMWCSTAASDRVRPCGDPGYRASSAASKRARTDAIDLYFFCITYRSCSRRPRPPAWRSRDRHAAGGLTVTYL